jgi:hypothetical protein
MPALVAGIHLSSVCAGDRDKLGNWRVFCSGSKAESRPSFAMQVCQSDAVQKG